jgi:hypothetical protein
MAEEAELIRELTGALLVPVAEPVVLVITEVITVVALALAVLSPTACEADAMAEVRMGRPAGG